MQRVEAAMEKASACEEAARAELLEAEYYRYYQLCVYYYYYY